MHYQLENFSGPLDLLLHLIAKNEIDIYDIPIAELTQQYIDAISEPQMEEMSEFLVLAATLLEIKSRMLLPRRAARETEDAEADPREALVQKLIEYKKFQALAEELKNAEALGRRFFKGSEYPLMDPNQNPQFKRVGIQKVVIPSELTPVVLWNIFSDVIKRMELKADTVRRDFGTVPRDRFTIEEKIKAISELLRKNGRVTLSTLFAETGSRRECVVLFLAVLEMMRSRGIVVRQEHLFAEVEIIK